MSDADTLPCSEASLLAREPLAGSASEAPLFAALAWPKARWHFDKAALSDGLPPGARELERAAARAGRRLQLRLFDRGGAGLEPGVELVCADFASGRTLARREPDAERAVAAIAAFAAGEQSGPPLAAPLVLVCTDGKHDRCCGKLGRSLVAALRGALDVAEASHLGGHRLAPNCLALPSGRLYGRVTPADAPALLDALRHDRVYLPCYRGRTGLSELEQVAEAAALAHSPEARELRLETREPCVRVSFRENGADRLLEVRCARETFATIASCGDPEPEPRDRWRVSSVHALD